MPSGIATVLGNGTPIVGGTEVTTARRSLGARGEALAAAWYEARGYVLLDRNWRCAIGEIDLVLSEGTTLVVCEVKTRSSVDFGSPAEAVDAAKRRRLRRLAAAWLVAHEVRATAVRFDLVAVVRDGVEVIPDAW